MDIYDINMNKLEFLISRDVKKEYRKTYYSDNKILLDTIQGK